MNINLAPKIKANLPRKIQDILRLAGRTADKQGCYAFVVGGFVRDLLLKVKNLDADIVVEGDGMHFADLLARKLSGTLVKHRKFGTATVVMPDKFKLDIATARCEYYEAPAALPRVRFSSLKDDLYRRDFTINAMAVGLNKSNFGRLIDFFGGQSDLRKKKIRVLHEQSFVDDPTRIFRAVRFEQRYDFTIDNATEGLIKGAVSLEMFEQVEKQRIRREIILILSEPEPLKAIRRMAQLHELRFIHPAIKLTPGLMQVLRSARRAIHGFEQAFPRKRALDTWLIYFIALVSKLDYREAEAVCDKFVFRRGDRKRILDFKHKGGGILKSLNRKGRMNPGEIYKLLQPLPYEVILVIMALAGGAKSKQRIRRFFSSLEGIRLSITGADLKKLGLKPGPYYTEILEKALCRKVDGRLKTKKDELAFVKKGVINREERNE